MRCISPMRFLFAFGGGVKRLLGRRRGQVHRGHRQHVGRGDRVGFASASADEQRFSFWMSGVNLLARDDPGPRSQRLIVNGFDPGSGVWCGGWRQGFRFQGLVDRRFYEFGRSRPTAQARSAARGMGFAGGRVGFLGSRSGTSIREAAKVAWITEPERSGSRIDRAMTK
jgi:hypothetical protein